MFMAVHLIIPDSLHPEERECISTYCLVCCAAIFLDSMGFCLRFLPPV